MQNHSDPKHRHRGHSRFLALATDSKRTLRFVFRVVLVALIAGIAIPALACQPLPRERYAKTEERVRARFDSVDSVELVTLIEARKVKFKEMEVDLEGEQATFRIDRTFKGRSKVGDTLVVLSYSTCARSVIEWETPEGKVKLSKQWLIYRNASDKTQITYSDMTQPLNFASYDLRVLPRIAQSEPKPPVAAVKIDTLLTPEIGGIKQAVTIKTDDSSRPVLLFLSGGPGSSMMNNDASFTNILKEKFTLVQWDQRDAGKTLKLNSSPVQPTVEQMGEDTYQVIEFLRKELHQKKIYLAGSSWGNVLGFYIVKKHPELLHAYFAVNPVVSQLASEKELLKTLKIHFKENPVADQELASISIPFKNDEDMFFLRKWLFYMDGKEYVTSDNFKKGFLEWSKTWSPVWNEVMSVDLPKTLKKVDCPIYFLVGKNDIQTSTHITMGYFKELSAPKKALFFFEKSGHQIHHDEPEKFQKTIIQVLDTI